MSVDGDYPADVCVKWPPLANPEQARPTWADEPHATELGACGMTFLLIGLLTDLTVVEQSFKGTGFDYWLGPKGNTNVLFQDMVRLEITGIRSGSKSDVMARMRVKLAQVGRSDKMGLPAIIAVIEFGSPTSRLQNK